jgi:hypothetical protein
MFRVGKENEPEALARAGAEAMVNGGRRMPGFIWVREERCDAAALRGWVAMAHGFVAALPPKIGKQDAKLGAARGGRR